MKYFNFIKYCLLTTSFVLFGLGFTACEEDIKLDTVGDYGNINGVYGAVKNVSGARDLSAITVFGSNNGTGQLFFELTNKASDAVTVRLKVDKDALDAYNAANGTSYAMYPENRVTIANSGTVSIAAGSQKSDAVSISVASNGEVGSTYALPISAEVTAGGAAISAANKSYIYLVKPFGAIPDIRKSTGITAIGYIEVNDVNLLNAGEYVMSSTGKPLLEIVNIFAANINYDGERKRAYVNCNTNVMEVLKNADKYIRPLQAKGIKVCLTILGNHDEAGVANLSDEAAADFARELKSYVDVYGLDGVDFDDEYSRYNTTNPSPGFVAPSKAASARLMYECRKIMPDKLILFYDYGDYAPSGFVEGIAVGDILDFSYYSVYNTWRDRHTSITGLDKSQYSPAPINLNYIETTSGYTSDFQRRNRSEGFGVQVFYNPQPMRFEYAKLLSEVGTILFDDEIVWTGVVYPKNTDVPLSSKPSYEDYIGEWEITSNSSLYHDGAWWQWGQPLTTTLTFEKNVDGKSYTVYGWYGTENDLPLVIDYNSTTGFIEIHLPQKSIDVNTGEEWTYLGRRSYTFTTTNLMNYAEGYVGYAGVLNGNSMLLYVNPVDQGNTCRRPVAMNPVKLNAAGAVTAIKGSASSTTAIVPYEQYNMVKK